MRSSVSAGDSCASIANAPSSWVARMTASAAALSGGPPAVAAGL